MYKEVSRCKEDATLLVRPLSHSDLPSIIRIDAQVSQEPKPEYWRQKLAAYLEDKRPSTSESFPARVVELDGKVVGFMIADIRSWEFGQPECGWIIAMGVDPEYQRMGIGRRLLAEFLDYFRERHVKSVRTMVEWAKGDLLSFFYSKGFERGPFIQLEKQI